MRKPNAAAFIAFSVLMATVGVVAFGDLLSGQLDALALPLPPGERDITHLTVGPDGAIYAAVSGADGGRRRFLRYDPASGEPPRLLEDPRELPMCPVPADAVAWIWDASWERVYCLSPTGELRRYQQDGAAETLGHVAGTRPFEPEGYQVSRALFLDAEGNVYTAGKGGALYRYSPETENLQALDARLPAVRGREPWASLDAAVAGPDGLVYGGTYDGYLFTFDPETSEVRNLGKPLRQQRICGLAFGAGGILYGVGGEAEGMARSFAYDPRSARFTLGGALRRSPSGWPVMDPVNAMVVDTRGNAYIASGGRLGNLYVWGPERE